MPGLTRFVITPPQSSNENPPEPVTVEAENVETLRKAQALKDAVLKFLKKECGRGELKKLLE